VRRRVVDVVARRRRVLDVQLQAERLGHPRPQLRMVGPASLFACLRLLRVAPAFDQGIFEGSRRARTIAALSPRTIIQRAVAFNALEPKRASTPVARGTFASIGGEM